MSIERLGLYNVPESRAVDGVTLLLQDFEGEDDVFGGESRPICEFCLGPQTKHDRTSVRRDLGRRRDETVDRIRLIRRSRHQ